MLFRFDLHRYEDVRDNATTILTRLSDGSMPWDVPGPQSASPPSGNGSQPAAVPNNPCPLPTTTCS